MAKETLIESRFDFRGGRNTSVSPDLLSANELQDSTNARIDIDGAIVKRTGSRRLHASAIGGGAEIKGLTQWDSPSGKQLVAISNGDLFYRNLSSGEFAAFTQVDPGATDAFSTTSFAKFATLRGSAASAALKLFIASGGKLYEWDGSTLLRLDGATSSTGQFAPDSSLIESYHLRIWSNSVQRPQHLIWSRIADGRIYRAGLPADGGSAMVSAIQGEPITNLLTLGRSLIVWTEDSTNRVVGYSSTDIQIDQDTEGISPDVGCVGPLAAHRAERVAFFVSDRGPYLASEGGIAPVGLKIKPDFDMMDRTRLDKIVVGHHHGRNEIWVAITGASDSSLNKTVYIYNLGLQNWYGPFTYNFGISCLSHYEDANGDEYIVAGCSDGFVRHLDTGTKDDVLSDGTGGSNYTMTATLAPIFFGHPGIAKKVTKIFLQSVLNFTPATTSVKVADEFATFVAIPSSTGGVLKNQRLFVGSNAVPGTRITITFSDTGNEQPEIHGIVIHAKNMLREYGAG